MSSGNYQYADWSYSCLRHSLKICHGGPKIFIRVINANLFSLPSISWKPFFLFWKVWSGIKSRFNMIANFVSQFPTKTVNIFVLIWRDKIIMNSKLLQLNEYFWIHFHKKCRWLSFLSEIVEISKSSFPIVLIPFSNKTFTQLKPNKVENCSTNYKRILESIG